MSTKSQGTLIVAALALALISAVLQALASIPPVVWVVLLIGGGGGFLVYTGHKGRAKEQQRVALIRAQAAEQAELAAHVAKHSRTLCIRYAGLAAANGYGTPNAAAWAKEIQRFAESVGYTPVCLSPDTVHALVTSHVEVLREEQQQPTSHSFSWTAEAMSDPMAFERACAAQLQSLGWDAHTTAGSGDQGIDVQGRKAGVRVVVQCKLYSQAVGNGAVQEAISGKAFAKAHITAVVSNAGFTRKAHELAAATGVLLLHHTELGRIDDAAHKLRQEHAVRKAAASVSASLPPAAPVERGIMGNVKRHVMNHS